MGTRRVIAFAGNVSLPEKGSRSGDRSKVGNNLPWDEPMGEIIGMFCLAFFIIFVIWLIGEGISHL